MKMTEKIKEQLLAVRASGRTNMFDCTAVQRIACEHGFFDLANYIEANRKDYVHFILTGEE